MSREYYYMRSGVLHRKYTVDEAVKLSADEEKRVKSEVAERPYDKQGVYERHWSLYAKVMGRKTFAFKEWFDGECEKKRRAAARSGR